MNEIKLIYRYANQEFLIGISYQMKLISIILSVLIDTSCTYSEDKNLAYALTNAEDNRPELEKVLTYYKEDSLKLRAARFLIKNMYGKFYLDGKRVSEFHAFIDSVYKIESAEYYEKDTIQVNPQRAYKYYRFISSDKTYGNMAEVEFYTIENDKMLTGNVIGTERTSIYYPDATKTKVFDGDPLTYFHTHDTLSWAGLALQKSTKVNKIRYIIRNDDNGIRKNNRYELFYIGENKQWNSAGQQIATKDDLITFDNVPLGTLYWLRNYTKGREERIFTYQNGKQNWW